MIKTITENNFEEEILNFKGVAIVDFFANWCGPCKMMLPVLESVAVENPDLNIGKVNVDEDVALVEQFQIMSIPTICIFKNGVLTKTFVGLTSKQEITDELKKMDLPTR